MAGQSCHSFLGQELYEEKQTQGALKREFCESVARESREICLLTKGSFKRKALLYFGSFSFFVLKKIFSFKSTVRFVSKSSVEKKRLD